MKNKIIFIIVSIILLLFSIYAGFKIDYYKTKIIINAINCEKSYR